MPRQSRSNLMRLSQSLRRSRLLERLAVHAVVAVTRIAAALPARWVLGLCDALGDALTLLDRRGRRAARANLNVAFGEGLGGAEKRRIFRQSYRQLTRAIGLLLHLQPLTRERFLRWVEAPADLFDAPQTLRLRERGGVIVSGHVGNWELLLGLRVMFGHFPPTVFLAEQVPHGALNDVLRRLRSHGDVIGAFRKGGARAVVRTVAEGGTAAILVDRNVRRAQGGVYAPFLGLDARTTPLPAWIALRHQVPIYPLFCLPTASGRYRLWLGPDLTQDLPPGSEAEQTHAILTRINAVLEDVIRAQPELWNWTLKRWKSRPTAELGRYPAYSLFDPDPPR